MRPAVSRSTMPSIKRVAVAEKEDPLDNESLSCLRKTPAVSAPTTAVIKNEIDYFAQWCRRTPWHCIFEFYSAAHMASKVTWLMLIFVGALMAIDQSMSMILDFVSSDQWVTSETYEMPKEGRIEWPKMTICGLDWIRELSEKEHLDTFGNDLDERNQVKRSLPVEDLCSNMVIQCGFTSPSKDLTLLDEQCCLGYTGTETPNCFHLNPNAAFKNRKWKRSAESRIYYLMNHKTASGRIFSGAGYRLKLYVSDSWTDDDNLMEFNIAPGTRNLLSLEMLKRRTVNRARIIDFYQSESICEKPYVFLSRRKYTRELCAIDCRLQFDETLCRCVPSYIADLLMARGINIHSISVPQCGVLDGQRCLQEYDDARHRLARGEDPDYDGRLKLAACEDECPEPCEYNLIDARLSVSYFVSPSNINVSLALFEKLMANRNSSQAFTAERLRHMTLIELYYESKQIGVVERVQRLSIDELIANIGGCIGVWSGLSILSILQIFIYIFRAIIHYVRHWRQFEV